MPLIGGGSAAYAIQAAATALPPQLQASLDRLRTMQAGAVAVLSSQFDDVVLLLNALGVASVRMAAEDLPLTDARIAFAGCPHRFSRLDNLDVEPFLARGGVLVSSDRASDLPGIAGYVPALSGHPPKLVRLSYERSDDLAGLHPLVGLDGGHRLLDAEALHRRDARILATDAHSGEPLVALVRAGNGTLLHAVPHWLQDGPLEGSTAVERRPLRDVPALASAGNSYPHLTLGRYMSQRAMLELLLHGIAAASESLRDEQASPRRQQEG